LWKQRRCPQRRSPFRISQDALEQLAIPAITLITTRGYNHFVVIRALATGDQRVGEGSAVAPRRAPRLPKWVSGL